ncbi:aminotransferase class I/II-fold pyridoxal phosphate-dependent enzyme [Listeria weihenstephanensis]|uniref:Aminotransferase class I/II-fold pyridoxal phosphate-dependent enzyme n=2 Tax=Listeria weihenstephanensis TaxID=1006155 RepID=A0A841Z6Y5_9LIST|nr:aminotransferase class I/II-fold pyridoxal phosphate-dependent enzyme [Listeria weihenstephanensis]MBC1500113.1 aminotransferase class I/II-fold pyridoxal phosphate-dependent enzyme [Listeria weihenstephanensis]
MSMQKKMPVVDALRNHAGNRSLHVPGHKNGLLFPEKYREVLRHDLTEVSELDDLHHPEGAILEAQQLLATCYDSDQSYMLVNGSTVGNLAMILGTCKRGDTVIVSRDCHKSVMHALDLAGVHAIYLATQKESQTGTANGIEAALLREALQMETIRAVVFTYPSYYGFGFDLATCIATCREFGALVLVDEAHGAHFEADKSLFPASAIELGADVVVHSAHKTLPALTMGSYLHIPKWRDELAEIPRYLQMLQSSSPSYLIMASLDYARHYVANYTGKDAEAFQKMRADWLQWLRENELTVITPDDPLKIIVRKGGLSGFALQEIFEQIGYFPELADANNVLLILPLIKNGMEFLPPKVSLSFDANDFVELPAPNSITIPAITKISARDITRPTRFETLENAIGKTAAEMVIPYPPGIPIILIGEKITTAHIEILLSVKEHHYQGGEKLHKDKLKIFI